MVSRVRMEYAMFNPRLVAVILAVIAVTLFVFPRARADDSESDEHRLNKYLGGTDAKRVLEFVNRQVLTDAAKADLKKLIEQMGDGTFKVRQEASRKLVAA